MKGLIGKRLKLMVAVLAVASCLQASAGDWYNPRTWFKKKKGDIVDYEVMIVTSNYVKSRVLAELIQYYTGQPILLLPTGNDKTMFVLGPKDAAKPVMEVHPKNYELFMKDMHPKTLIFLGNEKYVPLKYIKPFKDRHATWVVNNNDWQQIALSCEDLLAIKDLRIEYLRLLHQLNETGPLDEKLKGDVDYAKPVSE